LPAGFFYITDIKMKNSLQKTDANTQNIAAWQEKKQNLQNQLIQNNNNSELLFSLGEINFKLKDYQKALTHLCAT